QHTPATQLPRVGVMRLEHLCQAIDGTGRKRAVEHLDGVSKRPASHHHVEAENEEAGRHRHAADTLPHRAATVLTDGPADGIDGAATAAAADGDFGHHHWDADGEDARQVHQHEGATAVFAGDVRKLPDIAEANGRAGRGENEAPAGEPEILGFFTGHASPVYFYL